MELAGATVVIKGFMGFGAPQPHSHGELAGVSQDLPIIVEIVDAAGQDRSVQAVADLEAMCRQQVDHALERAEVRLYRPGR